MKINEGTHQGRIIDYSITSTKAGDPQVTILFGIDPADGGHYELQWNGSLKEGKAREITFKALKACGLRGYDIEPLADGVTSGALDTDATVNLVVEYETNPDSGKQYPRIRWINRAASIQNKFSRNEVKIKLGALNLKGDFMRIAQEQGITDPQKPKTEAKKTASGDVPMDFGDAPF
jgi:hypothetical protein